VQHAARVGFQPIDHLELYDQMAALLEPLGIVKAPELRRAKTTARVNFSEAEFLGNYCVVAVSSFGWLIHTTVGSAGGSGGLRTKRSGCLA
jgi:hypothetical protein